MAKKSKLPSVGDPGVDVDQDKRTPLERDRDRQEQAMLELISAARLNDGIVAIKRRSVNEVEFGTLPDMPASAFSEDNILKIYGGGDYKVQFKTSGGKFVGQAVFKIDYSIPPKYPGRAMETEKRESTADVIAAVTAAVKQSIPPPAPPGDNTLLMEMIRGQNQLVIAMMSKPAPTQDAGMASMINELKAELRELRNSAARPQGLASQIKDYMALQEIIGGGGSDAPAEAKTDWKEKLLDFFGPVAAAMLMKGMNIDPNGNQQLSPEQAAQMTALLEQQKRAALPAGDSASSAIAADGAAVLAKNETKPVTDMNPLFKIYLVQFRGLALQAAVKGRDAFEWADAKIDDIEEKYHEKIFELANKDTWFSEIFGDDRAATVHFKWLLDMRNAILVRWLVADVVKAYGQTPRPEPEAYAEGFVNRSSLSFHDYLWACTNIEDDAEAWLDLFTVLDKTTGKPIPIDVVWLEKLRVTFEDLLGGGEDVTSPASGAIEESQTGNGKKTAKGK